MRHLDDVDYYLYSLPGGNPYHHRELDARREEDRRLLLEFAGFPRLADIDRHIEATVAGQRPSAFLLSGREGAGRATLARTIMHRYVEHRGIAGAFHLVTVDDKDHDSRSRTHKILKAIRNAIIRNGHWEDHRERLMREVPDGGAHDLEELDLQNRAEFLAYCAEKLIVPPMHIGLLIDGVQEDSFMDTLAAVFENVQMVMVVTRDHYNTPDTASAERLAERERWQKWARHITLPPLTGDGVRELAGHRWEMAAPGVDCPFDLDGLRRVFERRQEPIGRALSWLGWLLHWRLTEYEGTERWPTAQELALSAHWIESMVLRVETAP
jgi:hypothetical protein